MMKKLLFMLSAFVCLSAAAQTETIETPGESIIVSRYTDEMTEIPVAEVTPVQPFKRWWFGADAGFSYRIAPVAEGISAELIDFIDKMRGGLVYGLDVHYAFTPEHLWGMRFAGHYYANSQGGISDKINIFYLASSYMGKIWNRHQTGAFILGASFGLLHFSEKINRQSILSQIGLGRTLYIGYDFRLLEKVYLGITLTMTGGSVNTGLTDGYGNYLYESTEAFELGIGLRF